MDEHMQPPGTRGKKTQKLTCYLNTVCNMHYSLKVESVPELLAPFLKDVMFSVVKIYLKMYIIKCKPHIP